MSIDDVPADSGAATRPMWEALGAELRREADDGEGHKAAILQLIARKLAAKALDGDLGAIKEIFDRMDGKSVAGTAPVEAPGKVIFQWKDPAVANVLVDYRPRRQFVPFHDRWQRFACIVTHRRAGKTVACIHDLQRGARRSQKPRPRYAYLSPFLRQSKAVAWDYLRAAIGAGPRRFGATVHESELRVDYPTTAGRCGSTAPTIPTPCAASISTASCSTNTPTWTRGCGRRSSARRSPTGRAGRCSSARPRAATPSSSCGGARNRRRAGSR